MFFGKIFINYYIVIKIMATIIMIIIFFFFLDNHVFSSGSYYAPDLSKCNGSQLEKSSRFLLRRPEQQHLLE